MQNINSVGKKLIKLFRYGTATCGILLGFIISFFMFTYYDAAGRIDANEADDQERYAYDSSAAYIAYGKQFDIDAVNYEEFADCDVIISDTLFYVGDSVEYPRTSEVVLYGDTLIYPIVEGEYPDDRMLEADTPCVVLGKALKRFTYRRDGKDCIRINGDEYYVAGYVAAENSVIFDYKVILYYACIGEGVLKDIEYYKNNAGIFVLFHSHSDITKYSDLFDYYEERYPENLYETEYVPFAASAAIGSDSRKIAVLIYAFSVIIIILVVVYWYLSNRKEFAIRRAYGYSKIRLVALMAKRLVLLLLVAMLAAECMMLYMNRAEDAFAVFSVGDFADRIWMMLKYLVITIPVIMIFPTIRMCFDSPDVLLREND